jgi:predicted secreted Zn-dependent protease
VSNTDEFAVMNDPDFLAERRRVREALEALTERYRLINVEFDRRAGSRWTQAS